MPVNRALRLSGWWQTAIGCLYPPVCRLCGDAGQTGRDLCLPCQRELPWLTDGCPRCAQLLAGPEDSLCRTCLREPPPFDSVSAPLRYAAPVDRLVQDFKFHGQLAAGALLGDLLAERLAARVAPLPQLILPVPLHTRRLRERGFNQALELARPLARRLGLPLRADRLLRTGATASQHDLPAAQRRGNVRGAFKVAGSLAGTDVAVVDDVMTTGHTAAEIARTLRRAGARRVEIWVAARALLEV